MNTNKIRRFLSVIIVFCMCTQMISRSDMHVKAASNGAIVYGADGVKSYTLEHEYVKELDINVGNINITGQGYSQVNGLQEDWDALEDAYVIRGTGISTNNVTVTSTNTPVNIYLVDLQFNGTIYINGYVNIYIVGECNIISPFNRTGSTSTYFKLIGLDENSTLMSHTLISQKSSNTKEFTIENMNLILDSKIAFVNSVSTPIATTVNIVNSKIISKDAKQSPTPMGYTTSITGSYLNNINLDMYSVNEMTVNNSTITNGYWYMSGAYGSRMDLSISDSFIANIEFEGSALGKSDRKWIDTIEVKNTYYKFLNKDSNSLQVNNIKANNSTIDYYGTVGYISIRKAIFDGVSAVSRRNAYLIPTSESPTPVDSTGNRLYQKKIRFRDKPNTYVLAKFKSGEVYKLLTDLHGYLFLYVPEGTSELEFTITDETGAINNGQYKLEFNPVMQNDDDFVDPEVVVPPTTVSFKYSNAEIEYSFDSIIWTATNTDSNCQFRVVFPEGTNRLYIKYNGLLYRVDVDDNGNPGEVIELRPEILSQSSSNVTLLEGNEGSIYVNAKAVNASSKLIYQWYKDGVPLTGETHNTLTFLNPSNLDGGVYTCTVTEHGVGNKLSLPITVAITRQVTPELKIVAQSSNKTVIKGYSTELYVLAQPDTVTYEWYKNGELIPGVRGHHIAITETVTGSSVYTCVVKSEYDTVVSNPMTVDTIDNPLESELADLEAIKNNLEEQVNNLSGQLVTLQSDKAYLESQIINLNEQIVGLKNQIENLQEKLLKAQEDLQTAGADKELLNQQIQLLNSQISDLQSTIDTLSLDLQAANNQNVILQQQINDLNNQVSTLENQIALLNQAVLEKDAENTELKNQIISLQGQLSAVQSELTDLQNLVTALTEQNNALNTQVQQLQNNKQELETLINTLQQQLIEANTTIETLTNQINALITQITNVMAEKTALESSVSDLNTQVLNLNNQITVLQSKVTELQAQLDLSGQGTAEFLQQIATLNNQVSNLNQMLIQKENQIEKLTEEKTLLQGTVSSLEAQIVILLEKVTLLQGTVTDKENEIVSLNNQIINLQGTITTLQNDFNNLEQEKMNVENQLNDARIEINNIKNMLLLIKEELGVTDDSEILPAIRNLKDQLEQQRNANVLLTNQINLINQQLIEAQQSNNAMQQKLQELLDLLKLDNQDDIKVKVVELQTSLINSQSEILQLTQEKSNLTQQLNDANTLISDLQKQIEDLLDLSGDTAELLKQIKSLNNQINTLVQQNTILQGQVDNLSEKVVELNQDKIAYQSEIVRLQTLLDTANSSLNEVRLQLADAQASNNRLKAENESLKKEIENLKKQMSSGGESKPYVPQEPQPYDNSENTELKKKLEQALSDLENAKSELSETRKLLEDEKQKYVNAVPENAVIVLPTEEVEIVPAAIKELTVFNGPEAPLNTEYITAEKNWELAKDLKSNWKNKIKLSELTGTSTKPELTNISIYAREKSNPQQVYEYEVIAEKPILISETPNFTMNKLIYLGSEFKLNLSGVPEDAKVTYTSSNKKIATVNKDGEIKAIREGKAIITGSVSGSNISYNFTVNVTISNKDKKTLNLKEDTIQTTLDSPVLLTYKLVASGERTKVSLSGSQDATVTYISSDSDIATIDKHGNISGHKKGNTTIIAILSQDDLLYTYIIKVRVEDGTVDNTMWDYLKVS